MKKEKKVRTYQRRTKSGKLVTVKAHTAKYDAAERAKELAKKKGAGEEIERALSRKKMEALVDAYADKHGLVYEEDGVYSDSKGRNFVLGFTNGKVVKKQVNDFLTANYEATKGKKKKASPVEKEKLPKEAKLSKTKEAKSTTSEPAFTAAEFKEWYQGTGSAADKKVAKALRAQLGRAGYKKLEDEAIDNYTPRGHSAMFKRVSSSEMTKPTKEVKDKTEKSKTTRPDFLHPHEHYEYTPSVKKKLYTLKAKLDESHTTWVTKFGNGKKGSDAEREKFLHKQNKLEEQYDKLINSSSKKTAAYKKYTEDLHKFYLGERSREENTERAAKRKQSSDNKAIYEKYGVTRKEVVDYMRSTPRKWKWDTESNAFLAKSEKKTGRVYDSVSLENAIRRMQRASKSKETKPAETPTSPIGAKAKATPKKAKKTKPSYPNARVPKPSEMADFMKKDWTYEG